MQLSRRTLMFALAALIAAFTVISVRNHFAQPPAQTAAPTSRIIIARHDLEPGTFVQGSQDLEWGNAPAADSVNAAASEPLLHEGSTKLDDFNGAVVRVPLHAGDPIPASALMKSGEGGFMSAVLNPGMRAVSISVNATSGNAGFVSPGDHVDMIVTHRVRTYTSSSNTNDNQESVVSETFVHNVRVVAVDQMLDNPDNKAILAKTITVEVSPHQAEQIAVAAEMGKISVALRSLATTEKPKGSKNVITGLYGNDDDYNRDSDLNSLMQHKGLMVPRVHVIRGDQSENIEFYQDAQ